MGLGFEGRGSGLGSLRLSDSMRWRWRRRRREVGMCRMGIGGDRAGGDRRGLLWCGERGGGGRGGVRGGRGNCRWPDYWTGVTLDPADETGTYRAIFQCSPCHSQSWEYSFP
jgi:hypothetical protein